MAQLNERFLEDLSTMGTNGLSGPSGESLLRGTVEDQGKDLELAMALAADPEHPDHKADERGSGDCKEIFMRYVNKKTNIYSTSPAPLSTPWTFWVDRTQPGMGVEEFEASLRRIHTVYSVHVFWGVYYNIPLPSTLHSRSSLHVTRDCRKPIWEEDYNCKGGTFRIRCQKKDTDKVWRELLMAAVGEQFREFVDPEDEVCGVSVSIREREDVVLIWNKDVPLAENARVFECVHKLLPDTHFLSETYKPHIAHHAFKKHKAFSNKNMAHGHNGFHHHREAGNGKSVHAKH